MKLVSKKNLGKTLQLKDQTQKLNERLMATDVIMPV